VNISSILCKLTRTLVLGMNHEFQRSDRKCCYSTTISTLKVPGNSYIKFQCRGLSDYQEKFDEARRHPNMQGIPDPQVANLLCTDRATAEYFNFKGVGYLINFRRDESPNFDLDSVMMYGSYHNANPLCTTQLDRCPILKYQTVGGVVNPTLPAVRFDSSPWPSDTDAAFVRHYYH
jgi:hypothetical protein